MKKVLLSIVVSLFLLVNPTTVSAQTVTPSAEETGAVLSIVGALNKSIFPIIIPAGTESPDHFLNSAGSGPQNRDKYLGGGLKKDAEGNTYSPGLLGIQAKAIAMLYDNQVSSREYIADILNNMGVPTVSKAYAQGTGYTAMQPFLEFWKVFRNLAYSLYIIMFVVVGIMIMLRTKVNAQTIITIQTALPNLLITLILITFSYAIVGFMIDIMYFLIYFVVYLIASVGIIEAPVMITRLMSHSAWSVIFEGRNSIISAIASSLTGVLHSLGTGGLDALGTFISMVSPMYLMVAIAFVVAMVKLMFTLVKSYVMLIVQTVTAPVQILMNAMPGSKAFSEWLKKTASYLIPFPVAAAMFVFAGILVGNPTDKTFFGGETNPFGVDESAAIYQNREDMWLPPFTLTGAGATPGSADILSLIGFFIFLMTPAAVKMAQDWLQVKESPYTAEAFGNAAMGAKAGGILPGWAWKSYQEELASKRSAKALGSVIGRQDELHKEKTPGNG